MSLLFITSVYSFQLISLLHLTDGGCARVSLPVIEQSSVARI